MNTTIKQFLLSTLTAGIFLILALGSETTGPQQKWTVERKDSGEGKTRVIYKRPGYEQIEDGTFDKYTARQGQFTIRIKDLQRDEEYVETANFQNNVRHGHSEKKYADGRVVITCWDRGYPVSCNKSGSLSVGLNHQSAYNILENEYPWYLFYLNAYGFEEEQVESFLNRIGTLLADHEFDTGEFDDYYDLALEEMEENEAEYSDIIHLNADLAYHGGYENLKLTGLRKAVIDQYYSEEKTIFSIVQSDYPNYLNEVIAFSDPSATVKDFELFCIELGSRIKALGLLNTGDIYFTDSLDTRLYIAFLSILSENESFNALLRETKSASISQNTLSLSQMQRYASSLLNQIIHGGDMQMAAFAVAGLMQQEYSKGDIIRLCMKKAYSETISGGAGITGVWEYWFNNDYSTRIKSSLSVSPGMVFGKSISTNSLDAGMHTLHIRFRDQKGLWSVPQSLHFFKGGQILNGFEYWFNDDYGNRTFLERVGHDLVQLNTTLSTSHLEHGMNRLNFRFIDSYGVYSPVQSSIFWKTGQKLTTYEYWLDDFTSQKITGSISGINEYDWIKIFEINEVNFKKLFIRYKDSGGLWSSVVSLDVPKTVSATFFKKLQKISLYPNPAIEKLHVSHQAEAGKKVIFAMYDIQGRKVLIEDFGTSSGMKETMVLDITHLINGVYLCVIEADNERSVFKAIINR